VIDKGITVEDTRTKLKRLYLIIIDKIRYCIVLGRACNRVCDGCSTVQVFKYEKEWIDCMEYFGWNGKILNVDLTNNTCRAEALDTDIARRFIGGAGIGIKILYDEMLPGMDALDPENPIIFAVSPMTETNVPSAGGYSVVTKSPLTNTISSAQSNGFFGLRLKSTGYDVVVIRGKAQKPVYLWIDNDQVEIRDAANVWGRDAYETEEMLKAEVGHKGASVACVGPAGENLVRYATIENDLGHHAASGGCGAVMGSKNLKAIVVYGTQKPNVFDSERLDKVIEEWVGLVKSNHTAQALTAYGTGGSLSWLASVGDLPTKNLTTNIFPDEKINGITLRTSLKTKVKPCYKCPINHVHWVDLPEDSHGGIKVEEPEYEGLAALGSNLGISDLNEVLYLHHLADINGLCIKTLGFVLSLCMECYEKGILTKERLDGIELNFGNHEGAAELIRKISKGEGIGRLLGENLITIGETLGASDRAAHFKGGGFQVHDVRSLWGYMLIHVISDFGSTTSGHNLDFGADPEEGYDRPLNPASPEGHALAAVKLLPKRLLDDCINTCFYNFSCICIPLQIGVDALSSITGVDYTVEEIKKSMYRIQNIARAFNIRHGLTPEDDMPSERLMMAPVDGPAEGRTVRPYIKGMVKEYYQAMGWDLKTSKPLRKTLKDLDLDYVAKDLWD